jgi:hypothetical protein
MDAKALRRRSSFARVPIGGRAAWGVMALMMLGLAGCREQVLAPSGTVSLETNAPMYVALRTPTGDPANQFSMEMIVAVSNGTEGPVTLQGCADNADGTPRFALSMAATKNDWAPAYEDVNGCRTPTVITLAVGESRVDRIVLAGPRFFDGLTGAPLGTLEGRMRLVYFVDGLTLWSNAFDVRVEDPLN